MSWSIVVFFSAGRCCLRWQLYFAHKNLMAIIHSFCSFQHLPSTLFKVTEFWLKLAVISLRIIILSSTVVSCSRLLRPDFFSFLQDLLVEIENAHWIFWQWSPHLKVVFLQLLCLTSRDYINCRALVRCLILKNEILKGTEMSTFSLNISSGIRAEHSSKRSISALYSIVLIFEHVIFSPFTL